MTRIEIFTNRSVEENLVEAFGEHGVAKYYSKIPIVHGVGTSGPRQGDAVWPEENIAFIIWCEDDEADLIKRAVDEVKSQYPDEGIKLFSLETNWQEMRFAGRNAQRALGAPSAPGGIEAPEERAALPAPEVSESAAPPPPPASFGGEAV